MDKLDQLLIKAGNFLKWILPIMLILQQYTDISLAHTRHHGRNDEELLLLSKKQQNQCIYIQKNTLQCYNRSTANLIINNNNDDDDDGTAITHLNLTNVSANGTLNVKNVHNLHWTNSNLINIKTILINTNELKYLDLTYNKIEKLENYQFQNYTNLIYMNLSNNQITDLPRNVFRYQNLQKLCLAHNNLYAIPFQVFAPMEQLHYLDLSYNSIVTILDHFFKFNRYIEILLLNNNKITKLTSNSLADLTDLKDLIYQQIQYNLLQMVYLIH